MSGDSFQRRVALLRDAWAERRQLKSVAGVHDFEAQLQLLQTLHGWAEDALGDIAQVYGPGLALHLSPFPEAGGAGAGFSVTVGESYTVSFVLSERQRTGGPSWFVSVA